MSENELYLGREPAGGEPVLLEADHLTTHAVCLGMTGSGKTGLGIVVLEELAGELQREVDSIAQASLAQAARIEDAAIRPRTADVVVLELGLLWSSPERLTAPG